MPRLVTSAVARITRSSFNIWECHPATSAPLGPTVFTTPSSIISAGSRSLGTRTSFTNSRWLGCLGWRLFGWRAPTYFLTITRPTVRKLGPISRRPRRSRTAEFGSKAPKFDGAPFGGDKVPAGRGEDGGAPEEVFG